MTNVGLVVAEFNRGVTEKMEEKAKEKASEIGVNVEETVLVPGAFDAPLAVDRMARKESIDCVTVIGAIIEGDTDHDKVIADALAQKITDISVDRDTPVTLGVTGPGMSSKEASERIEYGAEALEAGVELVDALPEA